MCLVDVLSATQASTVSLYHPSDFLRPTAELFRGKKYEGKGMEEREGVEEGRQRWKGEMEGEKDFRAIDEILDTPLYRGHF